MTADADRGCPVRYKPRNIIANNGFPKNSAVENIPDRSIRALPHLFKVKFFYSCFVRCDGCAFNTDTMFFYGKGSIHSDLVIGGIAVFNTEIIIFDLYIYIGEDQFILDKLPDNSCHFVAIEFYNRICDFDLLCHGFQISFLFQK